MRIRSQLAAFFRAPGDREQDRRKGVKERGRATSSEEEISQRETRRLAGMSADDQAWERAALQRNREAQNRLMP